MFSVVVPTFNRAQALPGAVESVIAQTPSCPVEVIVVDNRSTDETAAVVQELERKTPGKVHYVFEGTQGLSSARNAGVLAAQGDVVAFIDDDVIVRPGWLVALETVYRNYPDAECVGGRILPKLPESLPSWFDVRTESLTQFLGHLDYGEGTFRLAYPRDVWGGNLSVKRVTLFRVGLFNPSLGLCGSRPLDGEDSDLCWRLQRSGRSVYYCSAAEVEHLIPASRMTKLFFRERAYWRGRTEAAISQLPEYRSTDHTPYGRASTMVKDLVKTFAYYGIGRHAWAFQHELAVRKGAGYLRQLVFAEGPIPDTYAPAQGPEGP